jgi:hypothetical protein
MTPKEPLFVRPAQLAITATTQTQKTQKNVLQEWFNLPRVKEPATIVRKASTKTSKAKPAA